VAGPGRGWRRELETLAAEVLPLQREATALGAAAATP